MINTDEIRKHIAQLTSVSLDILTDGKRLDELDDWDSMAMVGTAAMIFELTNQTVDLDAVEALKTYGDIVKLALANAPESVMP
ncbi:MAG: hypothetical protein ABJO67_21420 [Pseudoruegeria sp.]